MVTQSSIQLQTASSAAAEATTTTPAVARPMHTTPAVARPVQGGLHSRRLGVGGLSVAVVVFALVLLLLLNFVLQNGQGSDLYYLGAHGSLPMGVALLLSAVFGALLVTLPAAVRSLSYGWRLAGVATGPWRSSTVTMARMSAGPDPPHR